MKNEEISMMIMQITFIPTHKTDTESHLLNTDDYADNIHTHPQDLTQRVTSWTLHALIASLCNKEKWQPIVVSFYKKTKITWMELAV